MSYGDVRKVSRQDIQLVQNLIERCLQLYMNQKEVVDTLLTQAKIEPGFTELVWQKLEEENREFFKAYRARLLLKDQILVFNELLEKQVELMRKVYPSGVSNGSNTAALNQIPSGHDSTTLLQLDSKFRNGGSSISVVNGGPLVSQTIQAGNDSIINRNLDASTSMLSRQSSHAGRLNDMDGPTIKSEPSYSSPSDFAFGASDSFLEACPTIEDTSCASFNSLLLTEAPLNEPLDILVNYGKSPYLASETNNFTDSPDRELQDDENWRLDTISEGISYDDFGSD